MENRIKRHRVCAEAFYSGLSALGLTPFAKQDARSNTIIALNYMDGMDDKKFRGLLSSEFRVLIAGGFSNLKGKVFRVGSMGEVDRYHVMRTIASIASTMNMLGIKTNPEATSVAMEKLKALS
jgi:aspartate aminotransferase-like enzyme